MHLTSPPILNTGQNLPPHAWSNRMAWRKECETLILGACLLHSNAFPMVMDILQPQNFKGACNEVEITKGRNLTYAEIWNAIGATYLEGAVDLLTVTRTLVVHFGAQKGFEHGHCAYALSRLTDGVASSEGLSAHAVRMVEWSMREAAIELLRNMDEMGIGVEERTALAAQVANERTNTFVAVRMCIQYLRSYGHEQPAELMDDLCGRFIERIEGMAEQTYRQHIITQYQLLTQ